MTSEIVERIFVLTDGEKTKHPHFRQIHAQVSYASQVALDDSLFPAEVASPIFEPFVGFLGY